MHEQEVGGVCLLAFQVGNTGSHRHSGNTGRADEGIDLAAGELAHHLTAQQTANGGQDECANAQNNDLQGLCSQEVRANHGSANSGGQQDGDDIHQCVLHSVGQAVGNTGLLKQVTQHQAADQRSGVGQQQCHEDSDQDGEDDLLGLGHVTGLDHLDLALLSSGQHLHEGRLDQGNQCHVGVGRHSDAAQQMGSQLCGQEDGGGAVSTTDDTDGCSLGAGKAQQHSAEERGKHAQLGGSAQQQALGVRQQRAEIGHGANAHEDQARVQAGFHADVEDVQQAAFHQNSTVTDLVGHKLIPQLLVVQTGSGQVGKQTAESDANQQQRLKLLHDGQIQQHTGDDDHHQILPAAIHEACGQSGKAGIVPQIQ